MPGTLDPSKNQLKVISTYPIKSIKGAAAYYPYLREKIQKFNLQNSANRTFATIMGKFQSAQMLLNSFLPFGVVGARDAHQTLCLIQSILVPTESPCQGLSESVFGFEKYRSILKLQTKTYYCYKTAFCAVSNFFKKFEKIGENFFSDQCV